MSPVRSAAGVGRTSIVCQCMSIKPGISVRPPPATTLVLARRSIKIGASEIFSIVLPRTRTFMVTLNASLLPSKIRTFSNSVPVCSADAAPCADTADDSPNPTSGIAATNAQRDMDFIDTQPINHPCCLCSKPQRLSPGAVSVETPNSKSTVPGMNKQPTRRLSVRIRVNPRRLQPAFRFRILIRTSSDTCHAERRPCQWRSVPFAAVAVQPHDLSNLDFVVLSHRHSDHMAGLVKSRPERESEGEDHAPREGFGIFGSSLPSSFYRKDESLPPQMRYYDGKPPEVMTFGTAWQGANFDLIEKTTEIAPGITLISLVSDAPGTRELRELSLAVNTPDGVMLLVGCSHPGIDKIVEATAAINPKIHLIAGGFHLVVAPDEVIAKTVATLKDTFKVENVAPGHCTGEPTFAALKQAFGNRYIYAGVGTSLPLGATTGAGERRGEGPALEEDDLTTYRKLARRNDPFGVSARSLR